MLIYFIFSFSKVLYIGEGTVGILVLVGKGVAALHATSVQIDPITAKASAKNFRKIVFQQAGRRESTFCNIDYIGSLLAENLLCTRLK